MMFRAGHKLEAAIEQLGVDVNGKVALDSGLSTGGFTDCLLQYGASFVYGVDVGYGQVFFKICFFSFSFRIMCYLAAQFFTTLAGVFSDCLIVEVACFVLGSGKNPPG